MEAFLEYIMLNYTWFLGGAIIILLAIIGYYADETNFGQGKTNDKKNEAKNINEILDNIKKEDQEQKNIQEVQSTNEQSNEINNTNEQKTLEIEQKNQNFETQKNVLEQQIVSDENEQQEIDLNNSNSDQTNFEKKFEKFDKEFNEILPEKDTITDDLLEEIDSLTFDKTQKIDVSDILDLDDVELPKIKTMESEEQDIWKF